MAEKACHVVGSAPQVGLTPLSCLTDQGGLNERFLRWWQIYVPKRRSRSSTSLRYDPLNRFDRTSRRDLLASAACLRDPIQTTGGHQTGNPIRTGGLARVTQFFVHPRHTGHAVAEGMTFTNAHQQTLVGRCASTGKTFVPRMESTARDLQAMTHQLNRTITTARLNRLILQDDSLPKNAAASRKKSRSCLVLGYSRLSAASS